MSILYYLTDGLEGGGVVFELVVAEGDVVGEMGHVADHLLRVTELAARLVIALILPETPRYRSHSHTHWSISSSSCG